MTEKPHRRSEQSGNKVQTDPGIQRWIRNSMKQTINPVSEADPTTQESQRKTLKFQNRIV